MNSYLENENRKKKIENGKKRNQDDLGHFLHFYISI